MKFSTLTAATALVGAGFMLSGFAGGGAVKSGPANVPYMCDGGRTATAIYEYGGVFRDAKVLLTFDGRTTELEAAPTLYGLRYMSEGAQPLAWALRGEQAWLSEVTDANDVTSPGRPVAQCMRYRGSPGAGTAHGPGEH